MAKTKTPVWAAFWITACAALPQCSGAPTADAVSCSLRGVDRALADTTIERKALLRPGERKTVALGPLRLEADYAEGSTQLALKVKAGATELFRSRYPLRDSLPPINQVPDEQGFTGVLALTHPTEGGNYQLVCRSVLAATYSDRREREAQRRLQAAAARKAALTTTLMARKPCALPRRLLTRDGPRCPPKSALPARVEAIQALHALGERDFMAVELEGAELDRVDLRDSKFGFGRLARASLHDAQLYFADFQSASLDAANLERANLWAANLAEASLRGTKLNGAKLQHGQLGNAELTDADLAGAFLIQATLVDATLTNASLAGAFLIDARLTNANLANADLAGADLTGAILDGANLSGARNLRQHQLDRACGNAATVLPKGLRIDRGPRQCVPGVAFVPCAAKHADVDRAPR
jgi:uncharacterized protein YjbI with pentapeptide repeats